ncbi:MGMT family protein [Candidatus Gracilibacteria bacterium]|nr:MGMT family protein [Candidatus Gracilibacteria bacterium]
MPNFTATIHEIVQKIPAGQTMTYKQVATLAGNPRAARAVGMIMSKNFNPEIPCHRVIRSDGSLGGYNRGGITIKKQILTHEASSRN